MSRRLVLRRSLRLLLLALLLAGPSIAPIHAEPAAAGSISGRITDVLTGAPIAGVTVEVVNLSIPKATTDADGRYRLVNVPPGKFSVEFSHPRYSYEYYADAPGLMLATAVEVQAGEETGGIDAALAPGGRIRGRITDKATGAPLGGVRAIARYQWYREWQVAGEGVSGEDGRYVIEGLWTSVYRVGFVDERGDHATVQYGDGADVGLLTGEEVSGIDVALPHEGHIAGQVTDSVSGAGLSDARVSVYHADPFGGTPVATAQTDSPGRYDIGGLAAGTYWLHFARDGYVAVYLGGVTDSGYATQVTVRVGETTGGIDQALAPLGGVSGRVTDAETGAALAGMNVVLDEWWATELRTTTGGDGTYAFTGVTPGQHKVIVRDPQGAYRDASASGPDGSETITVQPGRTTEGVDAALAPWAISKRKLMGTVTDVVTGEPLAGIAARLWYCYRDGHRWECDDVGGATTDAQGYYEIRNPDSRAAGITFSDPTGAYLSQDAADFRLPGEDEVVVIDMALQRYDREYGAIAGEVTGGGEPLAGQRVCADNITEANQGCTFTGADGAYQIDGLKIGEYKVGFGLLNRLGDRYSSWYYGGDTAGTDVTVAVKPNEITRNIDAALPENGRVEGAVYRSNTGAPLPNAGVGICRDYDCNVVETGADGSYAGYATPGVYRVLAWAGGCESHYYRDALNPEQATPVTVTLGVTTAGIDITLPHLGRIAGQVTDARTGAALGGITLKFFTSPNGWYSATSGADGRYASDDLPSGAYRVRFEDPKGVYATWETAEPVTVTVETTATVDGQLIPNGFVSGRVTAAESGAPLGGIEIRAGSLMLWTAPDGTYTIGPLPDGEGGQVRFWDPALLRQMAYSAKVTVKAGETTAGVDHAMVLLGVARGRVVDADTGAPIAGVKMAGRGEWAIYNPVYTDAEGHYELRGLDDGTYPIKADERTDLYVDGQSEPVTVMAGTMIDVPDIRLKKWGEFGGTVTDAATGQPVAGVWVQLYNGTSYWHTIGGCYAITGPDGTYRIRGLGNWTVRPVFFDPQQRYRAQSYGGGRSLLDAQTVTFTKGVDLLGVDAALVRVTRETRVHLPLVAR